MKRFLFALLSMQMFTGCYNSNISTGKHETRETIAVTNIDEDIHSLDIIGKWECIDMLSDKLYSTVTIVDNGNGTFTWMELFPDSGRDSYTLYNDSNELYISNYDINNEAVVFNPIDSTILFTYKGGNIVKPEEWNYKFIRLSNKL